MSANVLHSDGVRRDLLPDVIESGLKGLLRRGNGLVLLAFVGLGWLGLLSWEMPGPANGGTAVSHLLGRMPGQAADFLLQSFGVAAAILFAVPTFWAIELLTRRPLGRPLRRLLLWPLTALLSAGAFSAMPAPASWPFARGLGGVVGDQIFGLARTILSGASPGSSGFVAGAGLVCAAAFLFALTVKSTRPGTRSDAANSARPRDVDVHLEGPESLAAPQADIASNEAKPASSWFPLRQTSAATESANSGLVSSIRMAQPRPGQAPAFIRTVASTAAAAGIAEQDFARDDSGPMHVPYDDLPDDDEDSRRIAQKFAPAPERKGSPEPEPVEETAAWLGWRALLDRAGETVATPRSSAVASPETIAQPEARPPAETAQPDTPVANEFATQSVRTWQEAASAYRIPTVSLLAVAERPLVPPATGNHDLVTRARRLEEVLAEFGVRGKVIGVMSAPIVTHFEFETVAGVKLPRVVSLAEDIARALGASKVRVTPVPGRNSIGIELPNEHREQVSLRELLDSKAYKHKAHALPLAIGVGIDRQPIISDLASMPGLLIAGAEGSGKSMALNAMVLSLLLRLTPDELRLVIIDPKAADQVPFEGVAHLLAPVISDPRQALIALQWCLAEMDERLKAMAKLNLRGIGMYNNAVRNALRQGTGFKRAVQTGFDRQTGRAIYEEEVVTPKAMPYIVVVIEDLDHLLQADTRGFDAVLQRLGRMSRNTGIHVIASATRIVPEVLTTSLLSALPARLCFKLGSKTESRLVTGDGGGEALLGAGDLLFSVGGLPVRGQAPKLATGDSRAVADAIRSQAPTDYEPAMMQAMTTTAHSAGDDTEIYQQAVSLAMQQGSTSLTDLRHRLGLGYVAANDLLQRMQAAGLFGAEDDAQGRRRVLLGRAASA